jgi:hypothetical protein
VIEALGEHTNTTVKKRGKGMIFMGARHRDSARDKKKVIRCKCF